jgi:hypothetical protein
MRLAIVGAVLLLAAAAVVLSAVFAVRRPPALKASLIPWSLALGVDADPLVTPWESQMHLLAAVGCLPFSATLISAALVMRHLDAVTVRATPPAEQQSGAKPAG